MGSQFLRNGWMSWCFSWIQQKIFNSPTNQSRWVKTFDCAMFNKKSFFLVLVGPQHLGCSYGKTIQMEITNYNPNSCRCQSLWSICPKKRSWKVIRQPVCLSDSKLANHILSLPFEPVGSSSKPPVGARGKLRLALIHHGVSQSLPKSSQEEEKPLLLLFASLLMRKYVC